MTVKNEDWHVKKEFNLGMVAVLFCQLVGFGVLYGNIENRTTNNEKSIVENAKRIIAIDAKNDETLTAISRLPAEMENLRLAIDSLDRNQQDQLEWLRRMDTRLYEGLKSNEDNR